MMEIGKTLTLVDLDMPREGFRKFISAWILRSGDTAVVVDPGPASTYPLLKDALDRLGIRSVTLLLLTHIHIDHAGAAGFLCDDYPEMKVVCHPKGVPHLIDPSRLWEGSRKVLGSLALEYGTITPVNPPAILAVPPDQALEYPLRVIETPGHASHHQAYHVGDFLFVGEAAGIFLDLGRDFYTRPASPPVFDLIGFRGSISALKEASVSYFCFGHYGFSARPSAVLRRAGEQMDLWVSVIEKQLLAAEPFSVDSALRELCEKDPVMALLGRLPEDIRARELHFMGNAIAGISSCLKKAAERGTS